MTNTTHLTAAARRFMRVVTLSLVAAVALTVSAQSPTQASKEKHEHHASDHSPAALIGDLHLENLWARATPPGSKNGAAYLIIHNTGSSNDSLVGGSAGSVAERVEIHTHVDDNGVMRMRQVEEIRVAPDAVSKLVPGGDHVMLMGLKKQLIEGDTVPLTLIFKNAGEIEVMVPVSRTAPAGSEHNGHKGHDHGKHEHSGHDHSSHDHSSHGHSGHGHSASDSNHTKHKKTE
ncbi:MAG: copper chaperone PCu(A)C [Pseudomonadota bacterium]